VSLQDRTILLTRDVEQSREFITAAEALGASVIVFPTIRIEDPETWEQCDEAIRKLSSYDGVIFTSANAVRRFLGRCLLLDQQTNSLNVYAVGDATRTALEEHGVRGAFVPGEFSAAALAQHFKKRNVVGMRFLQPRGSIARTELEDALVQLGATVEPVVVYRTLSGDPAQAREVRDLIDNGRVDVVTFASPSAVENFAACLGWEKTVFPSSKTNIAVIGPTTGQALLDRGWPVAITAQQSTMQGLLHAIELFYQ